MFPNKNSSTWADVECRTDNSRFARIETTAEMNAAMSVITAKKIDNNQVWFALQKTKRFIIQTTTNCFSSFINNDNKKRLTWVDGGNTTVNHLPWSFSTLGKGNWSMDRCTEMCFRVILRISSMKMELYDLDCNQKRRAICLGG